MIRNALLAMTAAICLMSLSVAARADIRRETPEQRPYITEIGEPYSINMATLQRQAVNITELSEYMDMYGLPDYAEIQEISPEWPWESYEVRLYYMRRDLETDFGHVFVSDAMSHYGVLKFQGEIPSAKRHEIEVILAAREAPPPPPAPPPALEAPPAPATSPDKEPQAGGLTEALVARIEAAAERAAQAADQAAEQSEAAVRAANRTVDIVEKLEESAAAENR